MEVVKDSLAADKAAWMLHFVAQEKVNGLHSLGCWCVCVLSALSHGARLPALSSSCPVGMASVGFLLPCVVTEFHVVVIK